VDKSVSATFLGLGAGARRAELKRVSRRASSLLHSAQTLEA
jgi:hypothetical protein